MWKIFQKPFDAEIKRPSLMKVGMALVVFPLTVIVCDMVPSIPDGLAWMLLFLLSFSFLAGAYRSRQVRFTLPYTLPMSTSAALIFTFPTTIPFAFMLSWAYFTLGNAWKYWYLQRDPRRLSPEYRYFKDPRTRPQQRIIYGLLIMGGLSFPVPLVLFMILTASGMPDRSAAVPVTIFAFAIFFVGLVQVIRGIIGIIRKH